MNRNESNPNTSLDILLVAIGGYGRLYVQALKDSLDKGETRISAVVDPLAEKSPEWPALKEAGIPLFNTIEEYLQTGKNADLAVISSPIAFHADQACTALEAGMNVLCEKPLAALAADAQRMIETSQATGNFLEIGYQWSFSPSIQQLKADILAGRFGAPREMRTWIAVQRDSSYFARNNWGGRIQDDQGRYVYDSPANNATAHYLHNMLYLLGDAVDSAAMPTAVTGECYRGHKIENFDLTCCKIETDRDVDVFFYTTHCVQGGHGPYFHFEFDNALVTRNKKGEVVARLNDGSEISYGVPDNGAEYKLKHCLDRCQTENGGKPICGAETALAQTLCINALQQMPIHDLTAPYTKEKQNGDRGVLTYVPGLEDVMRQACESRRLFSEMNLPWTSPAQRVEVDLKPVSCEC